MILSISNGNDINDNNDMITWIKRSNKSIQYSNITSNDDHYLKVNTHNHCLYDRVDITLGIPNINDRGMIMLGIGYENKEEIVLTSIENLIDDDVDIDGERCNLYNDRLIYCKDHRYHHSTCIPSTTDIIAKTNDTHCYIEIHFNHPTSQPPLTTTYSVINAFSFYPPLIGSAYGQWIDHSTLHLFVACDFLTDILTSFQSGLSTKIITNAAKVCSNSVIELDAESNEFVSDRGNRGKLTGRLMVHPTEIGKMYIQLVNTGTMTVIGKTVSVDITACRQKSSFVPSLDKTVSNKIQEKLPSSITIRIKGAFGLSGKMNSISIPNHSISASGTFSLSFWMRTIDEPTGDFRCLFHKSSFVDSSLRTPSAWLLPHSNRIALRVSTIANTDSGYDTTSIIPSNQWNLLTFVFNNLTESKYNAAVYINGQLDLEISFTDCIHSNGPLYLFKDTSPAYGPRGFVKDFILWDGALSKNEIMNLYSSRFKSSGYMDVNAIDLILSITSRQQLVFDDTKFYEKEVNPLLVENQEDDFGSSHEEDGIASILLNAAKESQSKCDSYEVRLNLYQEASRHGNMEALYLWAMMISHGTESTSLHCGVNSTTYVSKDTNDLDQAAYAFLYSAFHGCPRALLPLSMMIFNGIGMKFLLNPESLDTQSTSIPFPAHLNDMKSEFVLRISKLIKESVASCLNNKKLYLGYDFSLGDSMFCQKRYITRNKNENDDITSLGLGMLFIATLQDVPESFLALSNKYQYGVNVKKDIETAARYGRISATIASIDYNQIGGQPLHQNDVLNDNTEIVIEKGNKGTDDEILQYQMIRAKEGDVDSQVALADGYYFGARGLPRDQPRALEYYQDAMLRGNVYSKCCVASMALKGEGTQKNVSKAIQLYEEAVLQNNSVKAMNGLGYLYFYGNEVQQNYTKAFEYFSQAALTESESDSIFNTGYCYEFGLGIEQNLNTAFQYYSKAAIKFGHFESINKLAWFYIDGIDKGIKRSPADAIVYINAVNGLGSWIYWSRRGLDQYLLKDYTHSSVCYLTTSELGFEIAISNAAFIIRRFHQKMSVFTDSHSYNLLSIRLLTLSANLGNSESMIQLGHHYYHGTGDLPKSLNGAAYYYTKASSLGNIMASVYLGVMYKYGLGVVQSSHIANKHFKKAIDEDNLNLIPSQVKYLVKSMQWIASSKISILTYSVDYIVKILWK